MKMKTPSLLLSMAALLIFASCAKSQDKAGDKEPIVTTIDPASLTYDYLVDGNLPQDDPANKKFKTLQAAYEAAPAGTERRPTTIGIRPNVYQLPGGDRVPSMEIKKDWITFLGLTNNRRSVVLADNRGLSEGSSDDGFMLMINCTGFAAKNLTMLNYCNCDYEYPGDPGKNLKMRNPTITQAVALQAEGDKQVYENVALLSRLDTMFLRTKRSYFNNVYIEGTDDFIGGGQVSYWDGCEVIFPTGHGVMSASGIVFANTIFESTQGMQFAKGPGRSVAARPLHFARKYAAKWRRMGSRQSAPAAQFVFTDLSNKGCEWQTRGHHRRLSRRSRFHIFKRAVRSGSCGLQSLEYSKSSANRSRRRLGPIAHKR